MEKFIILMNNVSSVLQQRYDNTLDDMNINSMN
jgi:hypothetical protein